MKIIILSILTLIGIITTSCSDLVTRPEEPQAIYLQTNDNTNSLFFEPIKERPNRDSVKKDTVERKKDTTSNRKDTTVKPRPSVFTDLLKTLNLTDEQKPIVEKLLEEHRNCVENCLKPLRAAEAEIFTSARAREIEIKKALAAGKITKSQAREKLHALKVSVNKALKELPIRAKVQECIKSCDSAFVNSLDRVLNERQRLILKNWIESRTKRRTNGKKDSTDVKPRG